MIFALVRTVYTDVTVPVSIDEGLFSRPGQLWMAWLMCLSALVSAALVATVDRSFDAHPRTALERVRIVLARLAIGLALRRDRVTARVAAERADPRRRSEER